MIQWGKEFFTGRGIDEARLTIEMMVCAALGIKRIDLYTDHDRPLSKAELATIRGMVERRLRREPLQYILGKADFYGHTYIVTPAVLIPRPETEHIVERVTRVCSGHAEQTFQCLDIGTGSGCIPISVILHTTNSTWLAIDNSDDALRVAEQNATLLGADTRFTTQHLDFLSQLPQGAPWDIVTMNPPYIAESDVLELEPELREHEPLQALTDRADGLSFYRRAAAEFAQLVKPTGLMFLEIGFGQSSDVENIFIERGFTCTVIPDLAGIARVIVVRHPDVNS